MSDIPEDIRATAERNIDQIAKGMALEDAYDIIASALLAERNATIERCAKVAETATPFIPGLTSHDENNVRVLEGEKIAAAIRSQAKE